MGVIYCTFHVVFDLWLKRPSWFAMCSYLQLCVSDLKLVRVRKIQSEKHTVFNATLSYATLSYVLWGFKTSWTLPYQNHGISWRASITAKIWRGKRSSKHMSRNSTDWHATQKCDQHGYSGGTSWTLGGVLTGNRCVEDISWTLPHFLCLAFSHL